jgi:cytochrome c-type biogenesis protein CcmE
MLNPSRVRGFASGATFTIIVCLVAMTGVILAFIKNSSPYVTVAQAKTLKSDNLHVAGDIIRDSIHQDLAARTVTFDIKDETGKLTVVYHGITPQNMNEAIKVVAEGGMKDGKLESGKLLLKCPSKYESEKKS